MTTTTNSIKEIPRVRTTVERYTDRLGSDAYNQGRSEQRAESVKAYLIDSKGVDAAQISAVGHGESSPVTQTEECRGEKRTPALITCLHPDRRVEIEVTGTQTTVTGAIARRPAGCRPAEPCRPAPSTPPAPGPATAGSGRDLPHALVSRGNG